MYPVDAAARCLDVASANDVVPMLALPIFINDAVIRPSAVYVRSPVDFPLNGLTMRSPSVTVQSTSRQVPMRSCITQPYQGVGPCGGRNRVPRRRTHVAATPTVVMSSEAQ